MQLEQRLRNAGIDVFENIRPQNATLMERFITAPAQFTGKPDAQGVLCEAQLRPLAGYRPLPWCRWTHRNQAWGLSPALPWSGVASVGIHAWQTNGDGGVDFDLHYCADRAELLVCLNQWMALHDRLDHWLEPDPVRPAA